MPRMAITSMISAKVNPDRCLIGCSRSFQRWAAPSPLQQNQRQHTSSTRGPVQKAIALLLFLIPILGGNSAPTSQKSFRGALNPHLPQPIRKPKGEKPMMRKEQKQVFDLPANVQALLR